MSSVLHVLLHMAGWDRPVTSEDLAATVGTNPVVIRRVLAGLRERGYVRSEKGHGGGWTLSCDLTQVTLRDVYDAVGSPPIIAIGHRSDAPDCLVEQAVNGALGDAFQEAETVLLNHLSKVTLARLSTDFHERLSHVLTSPKSKKGRR